jgi:sugar lactone lactonase YvrE
MTRLLASGAAAALGLSLASGVAGAKPFPELIPLPSDWAAEGVATGTGTTVYAGSLNGGGIWKGDLRTGAGSILVPRSPGTFSVGLKHLRGLLFVAGGPNGTISVYDADTGASVAAYDVEGGFVNDVTVTEEAAWFTDSFAPVLYRLPLEEGEPAGAPVVVPLGGDWEQVGGFNANGIAATPDGKALLVINSTAGLLYRVDPATGEASVVETDAELTTGDGILLRGKELAVVRNRLNQIAILRLSPDLASATLVDTLVDPDFAVPTTVAAFGGTLYAVNARFGEDDPEGFEIVKVDGS